jgi:hypothetical protein
VAENGSLLQAADLIGIQGDLDPYCKANCGLGSNFNNFTVFSSRASLWFLPWFALLAEIPYSTRKHRTGFLHYDSYRWVADHGLPVFSSPYSIGVGWKICVFAFATTNPENGLERFSTTFARS